MSITTSGKDLERHVESTISLYFGMQCYDYDYLNQIETFPCLIRNVPYINVFDIFKTSKRGSSSTEFGIYTSKENCLARIECKYQKTGGSVSEKYYGLYMQALEWPEKNILFYCAGAELIKPDNKYMLGFNSLLNNEGKIKSAPKHEKNMKLFIDDMGGFLTHIDSLLDGVL